MGVGLTRLRCMIGRAIGAVLVLALVLPVLFTALPSPASAEAQALYVDLMVSRCLEQTGSPGMTDHGCNDCCVMQVAPAPAARVDDVATPIHFAPVALQPMGFVIAVVQHRPLRLTLQPLSRRGPPA